MFRYHLLRRAYLYTMLIRMIGLVLLLSIATSTTAQSDSLRLRFFEPAPTFNKSRFNKALTFSATTYAGFSLGLYHAWYKQFEQEPFHFFNDWNEWNNIDKYGHVYTSYFQSVLCYRGARWTGLSEDHSILTGVVCAALFQTTIEVMDAFSAKWGFSVSDFAANTVGISSFYFQQKYWGEQRIWFKVSSFPVNYSNEAIVSTDGLSTTTAAQRADELFGSGYAERFLKDYNAQSLWLSINVHSFLPEDNRWPKWLNVALGYSSNNLFGGFSNTWQSGGATFSLDDQNFGRHRQYMLGLDFDFTRFETDNYFLNGLLTVLNIFKLPAPAIEYSSDGEFRFHLLFLN